MLTRQLYFSIIQTIVYVLTSRITYYEIAHYTARNVDRGQSAVMELMSEDLHPVFLPLDVDNEESILAAKEAVENLFGRLDVLVNNAGVLYRVRSFGRYQWNYSHTCMYGIQLSSGELR